MKKALILGIGGQDGSYLAEILLDKGYIVHGTYRRSSVDNLVRINHLRDRVSLYRADLGDGPSIERVVREVRPDEIYNEADQDHVGFSRETPQTSIDITAGSVQRLLETVLRVDKSIKVFQPLSATMFKGSDKPLDEESELDPQSPYAIAKLAAWHLCNYYRKLGVWVACGIMFNHESERRGPDYLVQRIVREAKEVKEGKREKLEFSNINMRVDIGHASEYMEAAYEILQQNNPMTFCIGTGIGFSIKELCVAALSLTGAPLTAVSESYPPMQASVLIADIRKARDHFVWNPKVLGYSLVESILNGDKK